MRKPVSTRTRFEIFKRDRFVCQYCGNSPPNVVLHVDHIVPVCDGGDGSPENLITSCKTCNLGKSGVPLQSVTRPLSETIALEKERSAQVAEYNAMLRELRQARDADFKLVSDALIIAQGKDPSEFSIAGQCAASVRAILRRIPAEQILEAVQIADERFGFAGSYYKTWKYFCGVCWRMVGRAEGTEKSP